MWIKLENIKIIKVVVESDPGTWIGLEDVEAIIKFDLEAWTGSEVWSGLKDVKTIID